jgi:hypothetical protein
MTTSWKKVNDSARKAAKERERKEGVSAQVTAAPGLSRFQGPNTFNDKQSQIAERKSGNGRGPGNHSQEAGEQLGPRPTPLTGRAHVGGGSRGKSPNPTPDT